MKTVRVSTTSIDAWLYFLGDDRAEIESLLQDLRGESPQNVYMKVGGALHKALENIKDGDESSYLEADGYRFLIQPEVTLAETALKEFKLEGVYEISNELSIELVGKVDTFHGNEVTDYKTMGRFDADRLLNSFQWRAYLDLTGADVFSWKIFEIDWDNWATLTDGVTAYNIYGYHELKQYRYPGMGQDVREKLKAFCDFLGLERMRLPGASLLPQYCTLAQLLKANRRVGVGA